MGAPIICGSVTVSAPAEKGKDQDMDARGKTLGALLALAALVAFSWGAWGGRAWGCLAWRRGGYLSKVAEERGYEGERLTRM